jgi:MFS family permease
MAGAYSTSLLVAGLLGVPIGRLVDRRGARAVMAAGSLLGGLSLVGLSGITAAWQLYLLWGVGIGVSMALTLYPVTFTVVANWFHRRRGAALALLTLVGGLSSPIYIPIAGLLVDRLGWREAVAVLATTQLVIALPLHALVVRRHPEDMGLEPDGEAPRATDDRLRGAAARDAFGRAAFWTLTTSYSLALLSGTVLLAHQVAFLIARGYPAVFAAWVAGLVGAASLPSRVLLNVLSDRLGPQPLLALSLATQTLGAVALVALHSLSGVYVYVALQGVGFGASSPLRASVMADHFGRRAYGLITAVQGIPVAVAAAGGPLLAGAVYDATGSYDAALWLIAGCLAAAALAVALTPRPPRQEAAAFAAPGPVAV